MRSSEHEKERERARKIVTMREVAWHGMAWHKDINPFICAKSIGKKQILTFIR